MAKAKARQHQLGVGTRLTSPPSSALVESFRSELQYAKVLYEGLSYADLAHILMLLEEGIIPGPSGDQLLAALVALHDGGIASLDLDAKWGDIYNNRDAALERDIGPNAGWLHAGRARREALTLGWLMHLRAACRDLVATVARSVRQIADVAEQHVDTLMPDFTYLQHAHPTTLGHFLLGFAYPLQRDLERLADEMARVDSCPGGSASTNGSRLPLNRQRLRELLGFANLTVHNRDAMWQSDVPIHLMAVLASLATSADRLAEELQIWATAEFDFVELADQHCRTSVIMPHKKNPYALAHIRGKAREIDGQLMSVLATNQTPSGQLDNRNTSYDLLPAALATVRNVVTLLGEVVSDARFHVARMRQQAESGFGWATELADLLMQREGIDARRAHEVVGAVVAERALAGTRADELSRAVATQFESAIGRPMGTNPAALLPELDAQRIVAKRSGLGSCAPESVRQMAAELRQASAAIERRVSEQERAGGFPGLLRANVAKRLGRHW